MCPDLVGRENSGTAVGLMDALAYAGAAAQGPMLGYYIERGGSLGYRHYVSVAGRRGRRRSRPGDCQRSHRAGCQGSALGGGDGRAMTNTASAMVFEGPGQPLVAREFSLPALGARRTTGRGRLHDHLRQRFAHVSGPASDSLPNDSRTRDSGRDCRSCRQARSPLDLHGNPVAVGDRITWSIAASCGDCFYCGHGLPQKCESPVQVRP